MTESEPRGIGVFWVTISILRPLVLVIRLLNERRRLLHDLLIGRVVTSNAIRAQVLGVSRRPS
jgi:predicted GNAT family N-acyltransferase